MRSLSPAVVTAISQGTVLYALLVELLFASPIRLNSSNTDVLHLGNTYTRANGLGTVNAIESSANGVPGLEFELHGIDAAKVSLALDDAAVVQGTACTLSIALLNASTGAVVEVVREWQGKLDTMSVSEDAASAAVRVSAEADVVDLLRSHLAVYNDADQQALYPGDRAFEYVVSDSTKAVVWPAKSFFTQ